MITTDLRITLHRQQLVQTYSANTLREFKEKALLDFPNADFVEINVSDNGWIKLDFERQE